MDRGIRVRTVVKDETAVTFAYSTGRSASTLKERESSFLPPDGNPQAEGRA